MQPSLVYRAEDQVDHHDFLLAAMAIKAIHDLHKHASRTEDTLKEVLGIVANGNPLELPAAQAARRFPGACDPVSTHEPAGRVDAK